MVNVVLLGKGVNAIRCAEWICQSSSYQLRAIVPVYPEPEWVPSLKTWANERELYVVESGDYRDLGYKVPCADLAISILYDRILSQDSLSSFRKVVNLHYSLLPAYRGISPVNWALKNGERIHGVTLHEMTGDLDAGPIIAQASFSIFPEIEEVADVYERCNEHGWRLLRDVIPLLESVKPVPQMALSTYYGKRDRPRLAERRYLYRSETPSSAKENGR